MEPVIRSVIDNSWVFIILLSIIVLLGMSRLMYSKFYATIGDFTLFAENQDKVLPFLITIHIILACLIGLLLYPFIDSHSLEVFDSNYVMGLVVIGGIFLYFIFRFVMNGILGLLLDISDQYKYILKLKLYYRIFTVFALLITILLLYYSGFDQQIILYVGGSILLLTLIIEYVQQFRQNGLKGLYTSYYFILYLCILEILPILYVLKHWNS